MSKQIKGIFNTTSTDYKEFFDNLKKDIKKLQNDYQEVEVQYSTCINLDNEVVHSALIIGRI